MRGEVRQDEAAWQSVPSYSPQGPRALHTPGWMVGCFDVWDSQSVLHLVGNDVLSLDPRGIARRVERVGRKLIARRRLRDQLEALVSCKAAPPRSAEGLGELGAFADSWRRVRLVKNAGSHWVLAVSLEPAAGHVPLPAAHHLLTSASTAMLIQLATGAREPDLALPLRGAITFAQGVKQEKELLDSSGLRRARNLERERASFPRTLICQRLVQRLTTPTCRETESPADAYAKRLEALLPSLWFQDSDGETVLDFFGACAHEAMEDGSGRCLALAHNAWSYVKSGLHQHRGVLASSERQKFEWLADYMRPRLSHWGVQA